MNNIKRCIFIVMVSLSLNQLHASGSDCALDLAYDINIEKNEVVLSENQVPRIRISASNDLFIDGAPIQLTDEQQALVRTMGDGYRRLIPAIASVAAEGVEIGMKTASLMLNAVFVDDPEFTETLTSKLDTVSDHIETHFTDNHFNSSLIKSQDVSREFKQEIDTLVQQAVSKSSGETLLKAVSQVLSGDDEEINDLKFRMALFADDFAAEIDSQASKLEQRAENICQQLTELDVSETQLQRSLLAFAQYDFIR